MAPTEGRVAKPELRQAGLPPRYPQVGYTVLFTLVYAGKFRTEDKSKTYSTKTKHNPEKANSTKHSKTKLAWFSLFLQHSARKQGRLVLQHS